MMPHGMPRGNKPVETSSFGDDFAAALDAAAGRKLSDQEALDFMNSEEGQHAVAIFDSPDDEIVAAGNDDPAQAKLEHIGYVFDTWNQRNKTVPTDLMSTAR
jgi:hypothetical protein